MDQNLQGVVDVLKQISEWLYQDEVQKAYQNLIMIIPKLDAECNSISDENVRKDVTDKLMLALDAMENEDTLLLADIIQYELVEALETL